MNERLYAVCAQLPDEERTRDRGAFFGSIHAHAQPPALGDRMWLGRFVRSRLRITRRSAPTCSANFDDLRRERQRAPITAMLQWAGNVTPEWLESPIEYASKVDGADATLAGGLSPQCIMFNHGTHHRGQLTTLMQAGGRRSRRHRHAVAARSRPDRRLSPRYWRFSAP